MNLLQDTKPENSFYCANGEVLKNLSMLARKLETMTEQEFQHHANPSKNDFHNWVRDIYQDYGLADELLKAKTPAAAAAAVKKRLVAKSAAEKEIERAIEKARKLQIQKIRDHPASTRKTKAKKKMRKKVRHKAQKKAKAGKQPIKKSFRQQVNKRKTAKKRKLNKTNGRSKQAKAKSLADFLKRKSGFLRRKDKKAISGNVKKQVKTWLNWLKIIPGE